MDRWEDASMQQVAAAIFVAENLKGFLGNDSTSQAHTDSAPEEVGKKYDEVALVPDSRDSSRTAAAPLERGSVAHSGLFYVSIKQRLADYLRRIKTLLIRHYKIPEVSLDQAKDLYHCMGAILNKELRHKVTLEEFERKYPRPEYRCESGAPFAAVDQVYIVKIHWHYILYIAQLLKVNGCCDDSPRDTLATIRLVVELTYTLLNAIVQRRQAAPEAISMPSPPSTAERPHHQKPPKVAAQTHHERERARRQKHRQLIRNIADVLKRDFMIDPVNLTTAGEILAQAFQILNTRLPRSISSEEFSRDFPNPRLMSDGAAASRKRPRRRLTAEKAHQQRSQVYRDRIKVALDRLEALLLRNPTATAGLNLFQTTKTHFEQLQVMELTITYLRELAYSRPSAACSSEVGLQSSSAPGFNTDAGVVDEEGDDGVEEVWEREFGLSLSLSPI